MNNLHRTASRILTSYPQLCIRRVSAHASRREFTAASPKDEVHIAEEPTSPWNRLAGAERIKGLASALKNLLTSLSDRASELEPTVCTHEAQSRLQPTPKVFGEAVHGMRVPDATDAGALTEVIEEASKADDFLEILQKCGTSMTNDQLILFLERFTRLRIPVIERPKSRVFGELSEILRIRMNSFAARDLVRIFKAVHRFEIDGDSVVLNGIIEALRLKLKDLSLEELLELFKLIHQQGNHRGPHFEMMKTVLPVIFGYRCREEPDMSNVEHCYRALMLGLGTGVSRRHLASIADAAVESSAYFSNYQACDLLVLVGLNQIKWQDIDSLRTVLDNCMETLAKGVQRLDERRKYKMLATISSAELGTKSSFDTLWRKSPSWNLHQLSALFCAGSRRGLYLTTKAAVQVTRTILARSNELTGKTALRASTLALAVASAFWSQYPAEPSSIRKIECERAANVLIQAHEDIMKPSEDPGHLLRFLINLAHTGVFPESLLQRAFSHDFQDRCDYDNLRHLQRLERLLLLHSGGTSHHRLKPELRMVSPRRPRARDPAFEMALKAALGGRFHSWHVETPIGSFIEFAVAMRAKDQPLSLPKRGNFFEILPPATKVIAFVICRSRKHVYSLTGLRKVGFLMVERELRAQNLCPIVIDRDEFSRLRPQEANAHISESLRNAFLNGPEYVPWCASTGVIDD